MELIDLEKKHRNGVALLKERGYYDRITSEVQLLIKYINNQFFLRLFADNLFSDIRGVFGAFIRQDVVKLFEEMQYSPETPVNIYVEREYMNLAILQKCSTNLRYQVKSLVRMKRVKDLEFKSSFLQAVARKLNGEIQELYRLLSDNYKQYFRMQFTSLHKNEDKVSLGCIENLNQNFDEHFLVVMRRFYQLSDALNFVRALFKLELENEIRNRIAAIFYDHQDRLEQVIDYFITDLKRNIIRTMRRNLREGRSLKWIQKGFLQFVDSTRFETLLRRVILQTLLVIRRDNHAPRVSTPIRTTSPV